MATYDDLLEMYKPKKNWANVAQEAFGAVSGGLSGKPYTVPGDEEGGMKDILKSMILEDIKTKAENERYANDPVKQVELQKARNLLSGATAEPFQTETPGVTIPGTTTQKLGGMPVTIGSMPGAPSVTHNEGQQLKTIPIQEGWDIDALGRKTPKIKYIDNPLYKSPADLKTESELQAKEEQAKKSKETLIQSTQDMLGTIKKVKEGVNYFGPLGGVSSQFTPSLINRESYRKRKEWENYTNKLLAQKGLDIMIQLKNASKTGATGFGQLSEKEGKWLRDASTALTRDVAPETAQEILNGMEQLYTKVLSGGANSDILGGSQEKTADERYAELSDSGLDEESIYNTLAQEGY